MAEELVAVFEIERDTKNTRRYAEVAEDGPPVVGTIYVQQWALRRIGGGTMPEKIQVTITVVK